MVQLIICYVLNGEIPTREATSKSRVQRYPQRIGGHNRTQTLPLHVIHTAGPSASSAPCSLKTAHVQVANPSRQCITVYFVGLLPGHIYLFLCDKIISASPVTCSASCKCRTSDNCGTRTTTLAGPTQRRAHTRPRIHFLFSSSQAILIPPPACTCTIPSAEVHRSKFLN
jgi:hypothetical protein